MSFQSSSWVFSLHLLLIINFLILLQPDNGSCSPGQFYHSCGNTFTCGSTIARVGYPFRGLFDPPFCGHPSFILYCDKKRNVTTISIVSTMYRVLEIYPSTQTMRIVREDLMEGPCLQEVANTTLDGSIFDYVDTYMNFTFLYGCPPLEFPGSNLVSCGRNRVYVMPGSQGRGNCNDSVVIPVLEAGNGAGGSFNGTAELDQVLQQGFLIRWNIDSEACKDCTESRGRCGFSFNTNGTTCFCPNEPYISDACSMASGASPTNRSSPGTYNDGLYFLDLLGF